MANLSITVAGKLYTVAMPGWTKKLDLTAYVGKDLFLPDVKVQDVLAILPEFDDTNIRVYAGTYPNMELVVFKRQGEDVFYVKTTNCNKCGECCRELSERWVYGTTESGDCIYLSNNLCAKPGGPPIHCLGGFEPFPTLVGVCVVNYDMQVVGV